MAWQRRHTPRTGARSRRSLALPLTPRANGVAITRATWWTRAARSSRRSRPALLTWSWSSSKEETWRPGCSSAARCRRSTSRSSSSPPKTGPPSSSTTRPPARAAARDRSTRGHVPLAAPERASATPIAALGLVSLASRSRERVADDLLERRAKLRADELLAVDPDRGQRIPPGRLEHGAVGLDALVGLRIGDARAVRVERQADRLRQLLAAFARELLDRRAEERVRHRLALAEALAAASRARRFERVRVHVQRHLPA